MAVAASRSVHACPLLTSSSLLPHPPMPPSPPTHLCPLQIVVLDGGQVVEQGSHKQLLRRPGGRYAALVSAQELTLSQTMLGT